MKRQGISYLDFDRYRSYSDLNLYNYTANAYSYQTRHTPEAARETAPVRQKLVKRRISPIYIRIKDKSLKIGLAYYVYGFVIFAGMMTLILLNAGYEAKKNSVEGLKQEINTLREANSDLRTALAASYDENEIAALAKDLGMGKPKPYQIEYINVPKESYAKGGGATEALSLGEKSLLDRIFGFFGMDLS